MVIIHLWIDKYDEIILTDNQIREILPTLQKIADGTYSPTTDVLYLGVPNDSINIRR